MPVGATIAGVSSIASAGIGYAGAQAAAKTQASAANRATDLQLQMFNTTQGQLSPFRTEGIQAMSSLNKLLGIQDPNAPPAPKAGGTNWDAFFAGNPDVAAWAQSGHGDPNSPIDGQSMADRGAYWLHNAQAMGDPRGSIAPPTFTAADVAASGAGSNGMQSFLESTPGYQFVRDQGIQSVNRTLGTAGQTGAQAKGIARFVTGLADQTYQQQVENFRNLVNTGANAAAGVGQAAVQTGANAGNSIQAAGTALAGGIVGGTNAITGGLAQIPSYLLANKVLGSGATMYSGGGAGAALSAGVGGL